MAAEMPASGLRRIRTVISVPRWANAAVQPKEHSETAKLTSCVGPTAPVRKS